LPLSEEKKREKGKKNEAFDYFEKEKYRLSLQHGSGLENRACTGREMERELLTVATKKRERKGEREKVPSTF